MTLLLSYRPPSCHKRRSVPCTRANAITARNHQHKPHNRLRIASAHLDLDIEHRTRVDLEAKRGLDVVGQALFVALLDRSPLLLERRVIDVLEQTLELRQILEEGGLRQLQRLADQTAQAGVALRNIRQTVVAGIIIREHTWSNQRRGVTTTLSMIGRREVMLILTAVGDVGELADTVEVDEVLHDGRPHEFTVQLRHNDTSVPFAIHGNTRDYVPQRHR